MGDCNSFILSGLWGIDGRVLIVPSGIETFLEENKSLITDKVLIVPSGIETKKPKHEEDDLQSINCT